MLLLTKKSIQLRVHYTPPQLQVTPVLARPEEARLAGVIAKNEELLAGVYLSIAGPHDRHAQLVNFFTHRGWQVEQV